MAKKETIEVTVDEALTGIAGQHNKRIQAGQDLQNYNTKFLMRALTP